MTWRAGVVLAATLLTWGDRFIGALRSRGAPLDALLADLAGDDVVRSSLAARQLERYAGADLEDRLEALLTHADAEVSARAARTLEMRATPEAAAILERHRARERRRAAAQLPDTDVLAPVDAQRLAHAVDEWVPAALQGRAIILNGPERTQIAAAVGNALVTRGRRVLFQPARRLVNDLATASAGGWLDVAFQRLDAHDLLIVDGVDPETLPAGATALLTELARHRTGRVATLFTSPLARAARGGPVLELPAA